MTPTLVLPEVVAEEILAATKNPLETAGVILAGLAKAPNGDIRLIARRIVWVPESSYIERSEMHLLIASSGYVPALGEAERLGAIPIWFHTHPGAVGHPVPSMADQKVDEEINDLFRLRASCDLYVTLIASPSVDGFTFTGAIHTEKDTSFPISRLWRVGDRWQLIHSYRTDVPPLPDIFDRSVRAFGPEIQETLRDLRIGIVGCGGTGSAVAEQLVRLGVRQLVLFDADNLTASNVTRIYGSTPADVGQMKTDILRKSLNAIAPDLDCITVPQMITLEEAARNLVNCDIVFGCTDDNAGRLVLSRFSTYFATPVIDLGVLISNDADGRLSGIDGRVTTLSPGTACLVCRGRVDLARAAVELRTPEERVRLANEGYAPALPGVEPAVVSFTTGIASAAITEFLERLIGFGPEPRPSEVLLRWHEREISSNAIAPQYGHYCHPLSEKIGRGNCQPFLEQAWPKA